MNNVTGRILCLSFTTFFAASLALSQELITDGELRFLLTNQEYTLDPDPDSGISPLVGGKENGQPVVIQVQGEPEALVRINFVLPGALHNTNGDSIPCYFGSASAIAAPGGVIWDADSDAVITLDGEGYAQVCLGITVTVPDTVPNTDYEGQVECLASYMPSNGFSTPPVPLTTMVAAFYTVLKYPMSVSIGDGEINVDQPGVQYFLSPIPGDPTPVIPFGDGVPMLIEVSGRPQTSVTLAFVLPDTLFADGGVNIPCQGNAGSLFGHYTQELFDPRQPLTFSIESTGTSLFSLGIGFTVPPGMSGNASGGVVCTVDDDTATGGEVSASGEFLLAVSWGLVCSGYNGETNNLEPGYTYMLDPVPGDSVGVTPVVNGSETGTPLQIEAAGLPFTDVIVNFALPSVLVDTSTGVHISCSFPAMSAYLEGAATHFDPNEPMAAELDGNGECIVDLGITVTIPASAPDGIYRATVLVRAEYSGLPSHVVFSSGKDDQIALAYVVGVGGPTGVGDRADIPDGFTLFQNYPNPFNPSTTIGFELPAESFVTLRVCDALGQDRAWLVNERRHAGRYSVHFDGSQFPSGVYYYRLQAGGYERTKKFLLLK